MKKLIIFDCDGVLVDSEIIVQEVFREELIKYGLNISLNDCIYEFIGLSAKSVYEKLEQKYNLFLQKEKILCIQEKIRDQLERRVTAIDGIFDLLHALKSQATDFCIASSGNMERICTSISTAVIKDFFNESNIFSSTMVKAGKPAPDLFLHSASKMKYNPEDCIVIEDSVAGLVAADAAGMHGLALLAGSHTRHDWYTERILSVCKNGNLLFDVKTLAEKLITLEECSV